MQFNPNQLIDGQESCPNNFPHLNWQDNVQLLFIDDIVPDNVLMLAY